MIKTPEIVQRPFSQEVHSACIKLGLSDIQARLVAQRTDTIEKLPETVFPKLKHIQHPDALKNSQQAAQLIADAIQSDGAIVLATDYDTDGVTSAWVAVTALIDYFGVPKERVIHVIGDRKTGYGITDEVCERILAIEDPISLVISADQGSSDEPRIQRLKQAGIDVCVTDHHQMPIEGVPVSAACTVNPQQEGCEYDKTIAGCFVIFLVMTQVRQALVQRGYLQPDSPSLKALSMNVALGTIADSVSLKSPNNRAIVNAGLQFINQFDQPSWRAMKALNDNQGEPFNAEYLAFQVATRINAASRVSDVTTAYHFLTAETENEAKGYLDQLDADNQDRRSQQQQMLEDAQQKAGELYHPQKYTLAVALQGNAGIQGIIATRIGEKFGLPTVILTDLNDGYLAGSGRGIVSDVDLREAFQWMSEQDDALFRSMGGHKGAAGCMIPIEKYSVFAELFEQAVQNQLGDKPPVPLLETDGQLEDHLLVPELIYHLNILEPYGREWPQPSFSGEFEIVQIKEVGQTKVHLSCRLRTDNGKTLQAIYFNAKQHEDDVMPFRPKDRVTCVYQPGLNHFGGRTQLQLRLQWMQKSV
ncbi:DHH family phosphoesterase [Thiomicrorhabdus sp. ZW0627]|uniref:single-stranded-DNA-specific exonuclease RecJ n=1 Tax=Thiomicrorhabdus sp. ZW0627 TaxID=3039774 RepID=UPI002436F95F|nr:DHH family phosphoesterase [Thiomicrorhabdus sp. ZW0627]MDG6772964.1 DHH family phosphoesterase [Thiomicrorhabdus sp. ZW0627]